MNTSTLLTNALLIDGTGRAAVRGANVLVEGQSIKTVSPGPLEVPPEVKRIDLGGRALLPGLIDAHVHVVITPDIAKLLSGGGFPPAVIHAIQVKDALEKTLTAGFTTVRDAGGATQEIREAVEQGYINGPRLLLSCGVLSQTGGHGDFTPSHGSSGYGMASWGIGAQSAVCDGVPDVIKAARQQLKNGADWIKVMAGGGVMSPHDPLEAVQFTQDELRAAVGVAKSAGKEVMAHCHSPAAIRHAVLAGVRSIEHGTFITEELIELMAERGCALIPTLTVMNAFDPAGGGANLPETQKRKMAEAVTRAGVSMRLALANREKIQVGSGTDAFGGAMQGKNGEELVWKAQMGLSPMEAIVSATKVNAEIFGLADKLGTVAAGKWADLIVVDGNPLEDVQLFAQPDKVVMVMKEGKVLKDLLAC
ncbi:MAG TPA: amidohydrolase family protein [Candidatus Binatia bacterium]|nr:amidohydrolase family protein [Candidatus Binatia bacterium]